MKRTHSGRYFEGSSSVAPPNSSKAHQTTPTVFPPIKFVKSSDEELALPKREKMETDSPISAVINPPISPIPIVSNPTENELSALEKIAAESIEPVAENAPATSAMSGPSSMMLLNQKYPGTAKLTQFDQRMVPLTDGTPRPYFTARLTLEGTEFTGEGWTKKEAKQCMAKKAMEALTVLDAIKLAKIARSQEIAGSTTTDPTEAISAPFLSRSEEIAASTKVREPKQHHVHDEETVVQKAVAAAKGIGKTAMQVLTELVMILKLGKVKQDFVNTGPENAKPHQCRFVCVLNIENNDGTDGETTEKHMSEAASSKKVAVQDAARKVLAARFKIDPRIFDHIEADHLKKSLKNRDPFLALNELCCRKGVRVAEETFPPTGDRPHRTVLTVAGPAGDRSYEGESTLSKRDSKRIASIRLVQDVFGIDLCDIPLDNPGGSPPRANIPMETAHTTDTQFQHESPVQALERIAAVTGVSLVYENVTTMPKFGVKLTIGQGEAIGFGHTQNEAKEKSAVAILQQMGLGQYFGHPQAVEENVGMNMDEGDEPLDEQGPLYYYPSHVDYGEDQRPFGWPPPTVGMWGETSEDPGQYWGDSYEHPGYQSFHRGGGNGPPMPGFPSRRGRGGRGRGRQFGQFGNDLHHHFSRPF